MVVGAYLYAKCIDQTLDAPGIDKHKTQHSMLLQELYSMSYKLIKKRKFPDDMLCFLSDWLNKHIAHHDQLLAKYVENSENRPIAELIYTHRTSNFGTQAQSII